MFRHEWTAGWIAVCTLVGCQCQQSASSRTEIPRIEARRLKGTLLLDGRLNEAAWREASGTAVFVNTRTGEPAAPTTRARLLWDQDALYVAFEVADSDLRSTFTRDDERLWEQDVVEVMLDPDGDGLNYFELQVSPAGYVFDTRYDSRRRPQPFGHMQWSAQLRRGVDISGTLNDAKSDRGYAVELALPWKSLAPYHLPPRPGDTWRIALYVLDGQAGGQRGVGWSPPLVGDFHVPQRFGYLTFR